MKEAQEHNILNIVSPWYAPEVEPGTWVISDDGYVVQCLERRKLVNKRHISGQYTDSFRFPQGTFAVYTNSKGEKAIKNFYAAVTNNNKTSIGNTPVLGRYLTPKKKLFATLVAQGLDPIAAYKQAYPGFYSTSGNKLLQVNKLLNDEYVREELMEQMKSFMNKIEDVIREKTGAPSLADFIAEKIGEVASDPNASNKDKLALIKELKSTFAVQLGIENTAKGNKEIQEANYEVVKPPQLGENT